MARAEILRETLRALEPGGGGARTEDRDARRLKRIDETADERRLRSHHDEADLFRATRGDHVGVVLGVERETLPDVGDAGIARGREQPAEPRALGERQRERMLPPTGAEQQYVDAGDRHARLLGQAGAGTKVLAAEARAKKNARVTPCAAPITPAL